MADITPTEISEIVDAFLNSVGTRQYIGARYVPIFGRKDEDTIAWDNSKPYEPLTIVLYQGSSYTSRQFVPAGIDIFNEEFWALTGNYNSQVEQYRQEVMNFESQIENAVEQAQSAIDTVTELEGTVDTLSGTVSNNYDALNSAIETEASTRSDADTRIEGLISAETSARESADTTIEGLISAETSARESADADIMEIISSLGKGGAIRNVMDYGAVADGTTNDSAAFQAAVDVGAGVVIVPGGTYRLNANIVLHSNLAIIGYGAKLISNKEGQNGYVFAFHHSNDTSTRLNDCLIAGFEITQAVQDGTIGGIDLYQPGTTTADLIDRVYIYDMYIHDISGRGINGFGSASGAGTSGHGHPRYNIRDCTILNTGSWGICNSGTSPRIFNCIIGNTGTETMSVDNGCANAIIDGCRFVNAGAGAGCVSVDEANTIMFSNCIFNQGAGNRPAFRANCQSGNVLHLMLTNCYMYGGTYGLSMGSDSYYTQVVISNCRCTGSSAGVLSNHSNDYIVSSGNNWFTPMTSDNKNAFASKVHTTANTNSIF